MRKALLFLLITAVCTGILAQYQDTVWTVHGPTPLNDSFLKWKPDVVLDARSSTMNGAPSRIGGLRLGVEYRHVTQTPAEIRQAYQGWIYVVKLRIKFAKLVRSIWDQSVRDEY